MKQPAKHDLKKNITNTFGFLGYSVGLLQWLWAVVLYLSVIQLTASFVNPKSDLPIQQPSSPSFMLPDPLGMIVIAIVVVVMVIITIYALIVVPRNIVRTSNKIVHKTAETMAPLLIHAQHKQDTKSARLKLTTRLVLAIKLLFILIPFVLTLASKFLDELSVDYSIALIVGCALACCSVALFVIQYVLAGILRVKMSNLW